MNCKYCSQSCNPYEDTKVHNYFQCDACHVIYLGTQIQMPRFSGYRSYTLVIDGDKAELCVYYPDYIPADDSVPTFKIQGTYQMSKEFMKHLTPQNALTKIKTFLTFS